MTISPTWNMNRNNGIFSRILAVPKQLLIGSGKVNRIILAKLPQYMWWFRNPARKPVEVGCFIPLCTRFFPKHPRWLALGFLNHQQYHIGPPSGSPLKPGPHEDVWAVELIWKYISWCNMVGKLSKNSGTPKWMVYNEWKTLLKWMIWGYHYFRNHIPPP